jgi:periplasmic protein TonB
MKPIKDLFAPAESKRGMFFQLGLITGCALLLVAFKWTRYESFSRTYGPQDDWTEYIADEKLPIIKPEKPTQQKKRIINPTHIELIPDKTETTDDEAIIDPNEFEPDFKEIESGDGELPDETPVGGGIFDPWSVERMPYYTECGDFENPETERQCTEIKIISILQKNARYPEIPRAAGIEGTVWLTFIVDEKGKITDAEVSRGVHPMLDKEALRVVRELPPMKPAKQGAKAVAVRYNTRVKFELRKS